VIGYWRLRVRGLVGALEAAVVAVGSQVGAAGERSRLSSEGGSSVKEVGR